jgi:hypothetical protein
LKDLKERFKGLLTFSSLSQRFALKNENEEIEEMCQELDWIDRVTITKIDHERAVGESSGHQEQ